MCNTGWKLNETNQNNKSRIFTPHMVAQDDESFIRSRYVDA